MLIVTQYPSFLATKARNFSYALALQVYQQEQAVQVGLLDLTDGEAETENSTISAFEGKQQRREDKAPMLNTQALETA